MSTIPGTPECRPTPAGRQYYSPLEAYWDAFRAWRQREGARRRLRRLTDGEGVNIGTTSGETDDVTSQRRARA